MDEVPSPAKPEPLRRGPSGCLSPVYVLLTLAPIFGGALLIFFAILAISDCHTNSAAAYSREAAAQVKPGDLDGVWTGHWGWEGGGKAKMTLRGNTATLENFPITRSDTDEMVILNAAATVEGPMQYYSTLYWMVLLNTPEGMACFFYTQSRSGEVKLVYNYSTTYHREMTFTRLSR